MIDSFFDDSGEFVQARWLDYWSALWSAPSQPGYGTLVREGVASLTQLADTLRAQAAVVGVQQAVDEFGVAAKLLREQYAPVAAASNDGDMLRTMVTQPLLTKPEGPLFIIGRDIPLIVKSKPLRSWSQLLNDEVVEPMARAAKATGAAVGGAVLPRVALVLGLGLGLYLIIKSEASAG